MRWFDLHIRDALKSLLFLYQFFVPPLDEYFHSISGYTIYSYTIRIISAELNNQFDKTSGLNAQIFVIQDFSIKKLFMVQSYANLTLSLVVLRIIVYLIGIHGFHPQMQNLRCNLQIKRIKPNKAYSGANMHFNHSSTLPGMHYYQLSYL